MVLADLMYVLSSVARGEQEASPAGIACIIKYNFCLVVGKLALRVA